MMGGEVGRPSIAGEKANYPNESRKIRRNRCTPVLGLHASCDMQELDTHAASHGARRANQRSVRRQLERPTTGRPSSGCPVTVQCAVISGGRCSPNLRPVSLLPRLLPSVSHQSSPLFCLVEERKTDHMTIAPAGLAPRLK